VQAPQFVPEYTPLDELLTVMQESGQHVAIVVDEFGSAAGLVTIQDLITQIIGDSPEVGDENDESIQIIDAHTFLIQAQIDLEEVNDRLNLTLPLSPEYQTLGGFLLYQWQRIPIAGETGQYANCELTVVSTAGPRIEQIKIHRLQLDPDKDHLNQHPIQ
jgi:CBS domain containing-hemolysin-like protein